MKFIPFFLTAITLLSSCGSKTLATIDNNATPKTIALYNNLHKVPQSGILFGQQDATTMGHIWSSNTNDRSDIKDVCGSHPAVIGADFSGLCSKDSLKVEKSKEALINQIIGTYNRGGITSVCWHISNPATDGSFYWEKSPEKAVGRMAPGGDLNEKYKAWLRNIAAVANLVKANDGELIPVIFRPFHEFDGDWFWWGAEHCTKEEFVALWQFTVEYLRDELNVHNLLYAFSPDCKFETKEEFLERYPGDEYVDMLAFDDYWDFRPDGANDPSLALRKSIIVSEIAKERGKLAAMSETGLEQIPNNKWFTEVLLPILKDDRVNLSYVLVWRNSNYSDIHYYVPFKGHPAENDFIDFYNDDFTIFEQDMPNMYEL